MGMEIAGSERAEGRPSILLVGSAGTGKSSILNRLRRNDHASENESSTGVTCYGWKIDTKYYTANVGVWMATLEQTDEEHSLRLGSLSSHCEALVMVFDLSNDSSFDSLKQWASTMNLADFDILLCVANKADRVPQHYAHVEYRRRLQARGERFSDPHPEFSEFGIQRTEGSSLLGDDQDSEAGEENSAVIEKRQQRVAWCIENGIEYIEACAINETFDECLSLDGDLQGVSRIQGALSAHMWQGLVMKPRAEHKSEAEQKLPAEQDSSSDDDSEFEFEYELLSNGSMEDEGFVAGDENSETRVEAGNESNGAREEAGENETGPVEEGDGQAAQGDAAVVDQPVNREVNRDNGSSDRNRREQCRVDEFEHMMQEMAGIRDNLREMPDAQRREVASQIAMRMASMFLDDNDDEDE